MPGGVLIATSQGVPFDERLIFSRKAGSLGPHGTCFLVVPGIDGEDVGGEQSGQGGFKPGLKHETGQTVEWSMAAARNPQARGVWAGSWCLNGGPRAVSPDEWKEELETCFRLGYPATRLAIANRGCGPNQE